VGTQGRPRRLPGEFGDETVGALVKAGNHVRPGEVFGGEVEGVEVAGGGQAEPVSGVLQFSQQAGGGPRGRSRANTCSRNSVALRGPGSSAPGGCSANRRRRRSATSRLSRPARRSVGSRDRSHVDAGPVLAGAAQTRALGA